MGHTLRKLSTWWLIGEGTHSPFFDPQTKAPASPPRVLTLDERRAL